MLCYTLLVTLLCLGHVQSEEKSCTGESQAPEEVRLRIQLAHTYSDARRQSLPIGQLGDHVTVQHGLSLVDFTFDPDRQSRVLSGAFWPQLSWTDPGLMWDPEEFGGLDSISMSLDNIWQPDIAFYNRIKNEEQVDKSLLAVVQSSGTVFWIPQAFYSTRCSDKPQDLQQAAADGTQWICTLKFGSWTYSDKQIDIAIFGEGQIDITYMTENPDWEVTFTSVTRKELVYEPYGAYPYLEYSIGLKRQDNYRD